MFAYDAYDAAKDADCTVLATEWNEFKTLDWTRMARLMARRAVVDARNALDAEDLRRARVDYFPTGRRPSLVLHEMDHGDASLVLED